MLLCAAFVFLSCETTESTVEQPVTPPPPVEVQPAVVAPKTETAPVEVPPPVVETPPVEVPPVEQPPVEETPPVDEEYMRSISEIESGETVSREDFEEDKRKILAIIDELADVMKGFNYDDWLKYVEPESVKYWQNARNLASASKMLPVSVRTQLPGQRLRNLRDYFTFVFVPSRQDRNVDEIRYLSTTDVKAVQVTAESDIIFYYFRKIDGKWLVHLPPIAS